MTLVYYNVNAFATTTIAVSWDNFIRSVVILDVHMLNASYTDKHIERERPIESRVNLLIDIQHHSL